MLRKTLNELLRISKMTSFGHVNFLWLFVSSIQYAAVRLRNVEVFIGLDKDGPYSLVGFHEGVVGASYTFTMPPNSQARYVNITRNPPYQQLTLCEVEVESPSSKFATSPMAKIQNSTPLATICNVRSPIGCAYACHMDLKCQSTNFNAATLTCDLFETPLEIGDASPASSEYTAISCVP